MNWVWKSILVVPLAGGAWGCSEAADPAAGGGGSGASAAVGGTNASTGATGGAGAAGNNSGGSSAGSGGAGGGAAGNGDGGPFSACGLTQAQGVALAVNELSATGDDWVELFNGSPSAVDLGGTVLADYDAATKCPKTTEALTFPAGTSLPPGEHLLIVADKPGASDSPQTDCLGATSCFHVAFGISGSAGDHVFLLRGKLVEADAVLPASAHAAGESWCREPDGFGTFTKCKPTPGAANTKL